MSFCRNRMDKFSNGQFQRSKLGQGSIQWEFALFFWNVSHINKETNMAPPFSRFLDFY